MHFYKDSFHHISRRLKILRATVFILIVLFTAFLGLYVFIAGPEVFEGSAANIQAALEVCPTTGCGTSPVITTEPTVTQTPGGITGPLPGLIVGPITQKDIFATPEEGIKPYITIISVGGEDAVPGELLKTYSLAPHVVGITNLARAAIFLEFSGFEKRIFTVFADSQGNWQFFTPINLGLGDQTLFATAISPLNPYFRAQEVFHFRIIPIPKEIPTPPIRPRTTPVFEIQPVDDEKNLGELPEEAGAPPNITRAKPASTLPQKNLFSLRLEVSPFSKIVYPGDFVEVKTDILRISPVIVGEEKLPLRVRIINPKQEEIFEKISSIAIDESATLKTRYITSPRLPPGVYRIIAELSDENISYVTTDTFEVAKKVLFRLPGIVLTTREVSDIVFQILLILFVLLVIFFILLIYERKKSRKSSQINEWDLFKDKDIM